MGRLFILILLFVVGGGISKVSGAAMALLGTNQAAISTAFPELRALKAFKGRIYMGYGDGGLYPAVVVTSYQPSDGSFHLEFSAYTGIIIIFRKIGGRLYVPSLDPVHYQDLHDMSYTSELSTDLRNWLPDTAEPSSILLIDNQWEKVSFRFAIPPGAPQLFY